MTPETPNSSSSSPEYGLPSSAHAQAHEQDQRQHVLRIRITEVETGQHKVEMTLPIGLVSVALRQGARLLPPNMTGFDLVGAIERGELRTPLMFHDEQNGERIEIQVE